ncbi:hypothetical protein O3P69_002316 [Scylla paramamosain]|uniref:Uncharacterized protein n=1 Tax=Scylla paramamosain TaxID=85552 RepID=A0AAW0V7R1_SCYPA
MRKDGVGEIVSRDALPWAEVAHVGGGTPGGTHTHTHTPITLLGNRCGDGRGQVLLEGHMGTVARPSWCHALRAGRDGQTLMKR